MPRSLGGLCHVGRKEFSRLLEVTDSFFLCLRWERESLSPRVSPLFSYRLHRLVKTQGILNSTEGIKAVGVLGQTMIFCPTRYSNIKADDTALKSQLDRESLAPRCNIQHRTWLFNGSLRFYLSFSIVLFKDQSKSHVQDCTTSLDARHRFRTRWPRGMTRVTTSNPIFRHACRDPGSARRTFRPQLLRLRWTGRSDEVGQAIRVPPPQGLGQF